ncbi:MATE family efflux transporter [Nocardioides terrigena]|uniref:MATE family efflux transporter n=1 Tax=Nocardioides terrigena TaxID=424797 RepID=UPI00131EE973|nr:polysaccharide biosynthesis C-terminal domain-containing protein [Nocardioides terrigena]
MTAVAPAAAVTHGGQLEKLARRGTASVLGAACSALFGILLVVVVTNGFSPTVAGTLFAATAAFLILESIALLGTDTGVVRLLPAHLASGRSADVRRTMAVAAAPVVAFSLTAAAGLYVLAPTVSPYMVGNEAASTMSEMLRTLALVLPFAALHSLALAATRGMGTMRATVMIENIGRLGLQSLAVLAAYLAGAGAPALALAWSLPYVVGLAFSLVSLRDLVAQRATTAQAPRPWGQLAREFWSYTAPRAIARVTQTALKRSDIVLVAALASPADAALYTAATRFIVFGQLFVQSVQQALSPQLSALFTRGETGAANSTFQAATLWSMIAAWPLYLVTATWAPILMAVFGDGYEVASDVVLILSLTMLLATACGPVDSVLLMAGHSWLSLVNSVVTLVVNVGLNLVLIPLYGIRGAAISWSVAIAVRNLLPLIQVHRHLGLFPLTRPSLYVGLGAVGCFGLVGLVPVALDWSTPARVAVLALSTMVYLAAIWSWRESLGLNAFRSALSRRRSAGRRINPPSGA